MTDKKKEVKTTKEVCKNCEELTREKETILASANAIIKKLQITNEALLTLHMTNENVSK